MGYTEDYYRAANGKVHFYRRWAPKKAGLGLTLVCLHGIGTGSWRFLEMGEYMADRGIKVFAPDLRGYGNNEGRKAYIESFDEYVDDWDAFRQKVLLKDGVAGNFLLGDSLGGLIAIYIALHRPEGLRKMILTSPALRQKVKISRITMLAARIARIVAPGAHFAAPIYPQDIVSDKAYAGKMRLCTMETRFVTPALYFAMNRAIRKVWEKAGELQVPALILQAGKDTIVSPEAPAEFAALAPGFEVHSLPDALHAFINDTGKEAIYDFIINEMS
ncbi:MAG: alpha/beta fold hydrolase [Bacillota bacterium]